MRNNEVSFLTPHQVTDQTLRDNNWAKLKPPPTKRYRIRQFDKKNRVCENPRATQSPTETPSRPLQSALLQLSWHEHLKHTPKSLVTKTNKQQTKIYQPT